MVKLDISRLKKAHMIGRDKIESNERMAEKEDY